VPTDLDEEIIFLQEWIENPMVEEGYIAVADIDHPRIPCFNILL
jgi:hypothetical protein